jgi:hypothetical protein
MSANNERDFETLLREARNQNNSFGIMSEEQKQEWQTKLVGKTITDGDSSEVCLLMKYESSE